MTVSSDAMELLRELAEAATPGPWWADGFMLVFDDTGAPICEVEDSIPNTGYIAAANPQTFLALLAEVERLRGLDVNRLTRVLEAHSEALLHGTLESPREVAEVFAAEYVRLAVVEAPSDET